MMHRGRSLQQRHGCFTSSRRPPPPVSRRLHRLCATDPQQQQQQQPQQPQEPQQGAATPRDAGAADPRLDLLNPAATITWGGRLPSRRRATVGITVAAAIALGGNLGGITSWLLNLDGGQVAGSLRLDQIVPVGGFKRCYDAAYGFAFRYPSAWLADQTLLYRAAQRAEASRALDPPAPRRGPQPREVVEPVAAFGPAGSTGEENISIIVAPIFDGFALSNLGPPDKAAQQFLDTIAAPAGSDKTAELIAAQQRRDSNGLQYYQFEFTIASARGGWKRHNVAALVTQDNLLYTLTAQCPASRWGADGAQLIQAVSSLQLEPSASQIYPGRL